MRSIDADELMEHVWRDKLDSRESIAKMVDNAPTIIEEGGEIMSDPLKPSDIFNISAMSADLKKMYEETKSSRDTAFMILELESAGVNDKYLRTAIDYFKAYVGMLETLADSYFKYCDTFANKAEEEIFSEDT